MIVETVDYAYVLEGRPPARQLCTYLCTLNSFNSKLLDGVRPDVLQLNTSNYVQTLLRNRIRPVIHRAHLCSPNRRNKEGVVPSDSWNFGIGVEVL